MKRGEILSKFAERAIQAQVDRRKSQADFLARGLASRDRAMETGIYIESDKVLAQLANMLEKAKNSSKIEAMKHQFLLEKIAQSQNNINNQKFASGKQMFNCILKR